MSSAADRPSAVSSPDDGQQLVARIAAGDAAAERELVLRYRRSVLLLARRQCRGQLSDAEDVTQDVLTQVIERLRTGELRDSNVLPHYLRQAIHNRCLQHFRSNEGDLKSSSAEPLDTHSNPLQRLLRDEGQKTLLNLMRELPQVRDRELLYRFFTEQQDRDQICTDLGIDPLHFRKVLARARSRMRELVERAGLQRFDAED